jgi:putative nucleotidyltransferase with HDIG domain
LNTLDANIALLENHDWLERSLFLDLSLRSHSIMVAIRTGQFSAYLGLSRTEQSRLTRAALLHDIGKSRLPKSILRKPAALSSEERLRMRMHPNIGCKILREENETDELTLSIVRDHHERLDGTGYPEGKLSGDISVAVRLVTLCDVFTAMTEARSYCRPLSWKEAIDQMAAKPTRLDISLLRRFVRMIERCDSVDPAQNCGASPRDRLP